MLSLLSSRIAGPLSLICVMGMGYIGLRLVMAKGMPAARSRFWVGAVLLLVATGHSLNAFRITKPK